MLFVLLLLIASITNCARQVCAETKVWSPKGETVDEWYSHPVTCPKTALRFENDSMEFLEGNSHEREVVFAMTGYYILQNNQQMIIGDSAQITPDECKNSFGEEIVVHSIKPQKWASPNNWDSDTNGNPAKPDIEKIPCDSDEIVFGNNLARVDMDGIFQLQTKRVRIGDKWLQPRDFGSLCKTVPGQKMFENCESVEISLTVGDPLIKACQSNTNFYQSLVCENHECPPAKCMDPIRPLGYCCDICGASVQVEIHSNSDVKLSDLNSILSRKLAALGRNAKLSFYSSFFNYKTKFLLQINLVDREEYSGASVEAMEQMVNDILRRRFETFTLHKSGAAYDPTTRVNTFALIFMPLLFVSSIFILAYKLSYDENLNLNWRSLVQRFTGRSQFIFAQFENVLEDNEGRITISHSRPSAPVVPVLETGVECDDAGMEMVAGGPEDNTVLAKDTLDEFVETISSTTNESVSLISVDME